MSLKPADLRHIDAVMREFRRFRAGEGQVPATVVRCSVRAAMFHSDERGEMWAASLTVARTISTGPATIGDATDPG